MVLFIKIVTKNKLINFLSAISVGTLVFLFYKFLLCTLNILACQCIIGYKFNKKNISINHKYAHPKQLGIS